MGSGDPERNFPRIFKVFAGNEICESEGRDPLNDVPSISHGMISNGVFPGTKDTFSQELTLLRHSTVGTRSILL